MVHAIATPYPTFYQLEIIYPDGRPSEYARVQSIETGEELVRYKCQNYLFEKLNLWLKQRRFANEVANTSRIEVAKLSVVLPGYERAHLTGFCEFVAKHEVMFHAIAPKFSSGHYNHYLNTITPILHYCKRYAAYNIQKVSNSSFDYSGQLESNSATRMCETLKAG